MTLGMQLLCLQTHVVLFSVYKQELTNPDEYTSNTYQPTWTLVTLYNKLILACSLIKKKYLLYLYLLYLLQQLTIIVDKSNKVQLSKFRLS